MPTVAIVAPKQIHTTGRPIFLPRLVVGPALVEPGHDIAPRPTAPWSPSCIAWSRTPAAPLGAPALLYTFGASGRELMDSTHRNGLDRPRSGCAIRGFPSRGRVVTRRRMRSTDRLRESYRKLGSLPASPQVSGVMTRVSDKTQEGTTEGPLSTAMTPERERCGAQVYASPLLRAGKFADYQCRRVFKAIGTCSTQSVSVGWTPDTQPLSDPRGFLPCLR